MLSLAFSSATIDVNSFAEQYIYTYCPSSTEIVPSPIRIGSAACEIYLNPSSKASSNTYICHLIVSEFSAVKVYSANVSAPEINSR